MSLRSEIGDWWAEFCRIAPGRTGYLLRRRLAAHRAKAVGPDLVVSPGVWVNGWRNLRLGARVGFGRDCIIETTNGQVTIGDDCKFNSRVTLAADHGEIRLGRQVIVGMNVVLRAANHRFDRSPEVPIHEQGHDRGKIVIGDDVWIGANVTILAGARIGDHCVIAAGAVVLGEIPSCSVAVGAPARVSRSVGRRDAPGDLEALGG